MYYREEKKSGFFNSAARDDKIKYIIFIRHYKHILMSEIYKYIIMIESGI